MDKFSFITLWDIYNGLLTPTQQEITHLYFNLDLTLSEIAEQKGITRQGVSECLKTCKKQLEEYESKLHFAENKQKYSLEVSFMLTDAQRWAEEFKTAHPEFSEELDCLLKILVRDYSAEAEQKLHDVAVMEILEKDYTEAVFGRKKTGEE